MTPAPILCRTALAVLAVAATACRSQIQHGLTEHDANEITTALVSRGFDARKAAEKGKKPTWAIEVDDEHATDALRVLTELKLPRPPRTTTREIASQTGLIETPSAERLGSSEALEGDIEQRSKGWMGSPRGGRTGPRPATAGQSAASSLALLRPPLSLEAPAAAGRDPRPDRRLGGRTQGRGRMVLIDPVTTQVPTPARLRRRPTNALARGRRDTGDCPRSRWSR